MDGMWCVLEAPDFRFVEVSKSYLDHFNLPLSVVGMPFGDLPALQPERKCELIEKLERLVRTGTPFVSWDEVMNVKTRDTTLMRWVNTAAKMEAPGMPFRVNCYGKIVKDRRNHPRIESRANTA